MKTERAQFYKIVSCVLAGSILPQAGFACGCGCGVFEVGTSSMLPSGPGGMAIFNYYYQDQNGNWSGSSRTSAENNPDKEIKTDFFSLGVQYMINGSWGFDVEVPYNYREFTTTDESGNIVTRRWSQLGDIRLKGIYTGFTPDLSAGVTLGVKLPTGSYTFSPDVVDRDTQLGSGSTDLLLGGFYRHNLTSNGLLDWFAQAELDVPVLIQDDYRPGAELDTAAGVYYEGLKIGRLRITPIAQMIFSGRTSDSGANAANPVASGFERFLLSPGIELGIHPVKLYADAEFPVYQRFTGNQVAASVLFKVSLSVMF